MPKLTKPGKVQHLLVVASGKGGVGKTTVSVNLALGLLRKGRRVALLDADMYGPNVPLMLGVTRTQGPKGMQAFWPISTPGVRAPTDVVQPLERFGLRVMSAGFLIGDSQAVQIGSSHMQGKVFESILRMVDWGDADTMVIDLPPGTDEPLQTITLTTEITGGIVVTTPQDVARLDAQREIERFRRLSISMIGLVENMSYFVCAHCGERQEVFHRGTRYEDLEAPLLGQVPLDSETSAMADRGRPLLLSESGGPAAAAFLKVADEVDRRLGPA